MAAVVIVKFTYITMLKGRLAENTELKTQQDKREKEGGTVVACMTLFFLPLHPPPRAFPPLSLQAFLPSSPPSSPARQMHRSLQLSLRSLESRSV